MLYLGMLLLALLAAGVDQLSKLWVLGNIPLGTEISCVPGLFHLTYVQNRGAAFSMLQGHQWLFILVFVVLVVLLVWAVAKKVLPFRNFELWCIAAILGGGLGNVIDRFVHGFVVDMIEVEFMNFPVFNVADSFITCGAILLGIHLVFFNRTFWKDEK